MGGWKDGRVRGRVGMEVEEGEMCVVERWCLYGCVESGLSGRGNREWGMGLWVDCMSG